MKNALRPVRLQVYAVVLVCTGEQWEAVEQQFPNTRPGSFQGRQFLSRNFGPRRVVLLRCGPGIIAAAAATQFAIDRWKPSALLLTMPHEGEDQAIREVAQINDMRIAEQPVLATALDRSVPEAIASLHKPAAIPAVALAESDPDAQE